MFYKQIQGFMLPSFANLVTEALPLDLLVQHRLGWEPKAVKINDAWPQARELAVQFWPCAVSDSRMGDEFPSVAKANTGLVNGL